MLTLFTTGWRLRVSALSPFSADGQVPGDVRDGGIIGINRMSPEIHWYVHLEKTAV